MSNRWNIARLHVSSGCLQSDPCRHACSFEMNSGHMVVAPFTRGDDIWLILVLLGHDRAGADGDELAVFTREHLADEYQAHVTPDALIAMAARLDVAVANADATIVVADLGARA